MEIRWKRIAGVIAGLLAASVVWAQAPGGAPGGRPGKRGGRPGGPGGRMGGFAGMMMLQQFDKNGDLQVDADELRTGLEKIGQQAAEAYSKLLALFDENKNGKLDPQETKKVQDFLRVINMSRWLDSNHDMQISDDELEQAWNRLAEAAQRRNEFLLRRYDKNQDGQLSPDEVAEAKKEMQRRFQQFRRGGGRPPRAAGNR